MLFRRRTSAGETKAPCDLQNRDRRGSVFMLLRPVIQVQAVGRRVANQRFVFSASIAEHGSAVLM